MEINKINVEKLKNKMKEERYTFRLFSKELGITEDGLRKKFQKPTTFKFGEVLKICELLKLSNEEYKDIFEGE